MNGRELHRVGARPGRALPVLAAVSTLAVLVGACQSGRSDRVRIGWSQRGEASWYGRPFHGQRTASGERYDMYLMTAAHRELPLGTVLEVRNVDNGRRVQVRVNDRGPFVRGRILDLSYGAASELGMVQTGTALVELRVVEMGPVALPDGGLLTVQVGAFQHRDRADAVLAKLAAEFPEARVEESLPWYRVRVGTFSALADARDLQARLRRRGFRSIVTRAGLGPVLSAEAPPASP